MTTVVVRRLLLSLMILPLTACVAGPYGAGHAVSRLSQSAYVVSDGWHTGLVIARDQVASPIWPEGSDFARFKYLEMGWGDKATYVAQRITLRLALGAAFWSTSSALLVAGFNAPVAEYFRSLDVVEVRLDPRALEEVSQFIRQSYARDGNGNAIRLGRGYSEHSAFYLATGRYHLFNTCNTWTARALRLAGYPVVPALTWTATQLMEQVMAFGHALRTGPT